MGRCSFVTSTGHQCERKCNTEYCWQHEKSVKKTTTNKDDNTTMRTTANTSKKTTRKVEPVSTVIEAIPREQLIVKRKSNNDNKDQQEEEDGPYHVIIICHNSGEHNHECYKNKRDFIKAAKEWIQETLKNITGESSITSNMNKILKTKNDNIDIKELIWAILEYGEVVMYQNVGDVWCYVIHGGKMFK
jgi:hypothetical protein